MTALPGFYKLNLSLEVKDVKGCSKKDQTCPFTYPDDARAALGYAYKAWAIADSVPSFDNNFEPRCSQACTTSDDCDENDVCVSPGRDCARSGTVCARVEKLPGCSHKRWESLVVPEELMKSFQP